MRLIINLFIILIVLQVDTLLNFLLPYDYSYTTITIVSSLCILIFDILILHMKDHEYLFGIVFGVYFSIVYGGFLLIYPLLFILFVYIIKQYYKFKFKNTFQYFLLFISTIFLYHFSVYLFMYIGNNTKVGINTYLFLQLLPTMLLNMLYCLLGSMIVKKLIKR